MTRAPQVDEDLEVDLHGLGDAGALHLDRHRRAVGQRGAVDLADAGGGERRRCRTSAKSSSTGRPSSSSMRAAHLVPRQRGHVVLQLGELHGEVGRHEVAARGEDLAHLDERRAEPLERPADAHGARQVLLLDAGVALRGAPPPAARAPPARRP